VDLYLRGNVLTLDGEATEVRTAETVVGELVDLIEQGHEIAPGTIEAVTGASTSTRPVEILEDVVWQHATRGWRPRPSTRSNTSTRSAAHITFGIARGTGKDLPGRGDGAAALSRADVSRVILTRPAVEAGERLGFLPGDIQAKVDPYCGRSSTPSTTCSIRRRSTLLRARHDRGRPLHSCAAGP